MTPFVSSHACSCQLSSCVLSHLLEEDVVLPQQKFAKCSEIPTERFLWVFSWVLKKVFTDLGDQNQLPTQPLCSFASSRAL